MASKSKPQRHKKQKLETRPKRRLGRTKSGTPVMTTDMGPSLARMRVVGKDLPEDHDLEPRTPGSPSSHHLQEGMILLARGTDALVTRVVNSAREGARDPAEHLLDLSRAYYQEETSEGQHSVQCDRCLLKSPGSATRTGSEALARSLGWIVTDDYDHCPVCKDGGFLLGAGAASALAVPPALTPAEMILVVRIRYVVDKIEKGATVEAFLQNAIRSGHRSMLSDLAMEYGYSTVGLIEKVMALTTRGVEVHPLFLTDSRKIWSFFLKLYDLIQAEDRPEPVSPG